MCSSDLTPRHLSNIKRLAYEIRPVPSSARVSAVEPATVRAAAPTATPVISRDDLANRIDRFLAGRGYKASATADAPTPLPPAPAAAAQPLPFICEDDVRSALKAGTTLIANARTIVTPSARELAEARHVIVYEADGGS